MGQRQVHPRLKELWDNNIPVYSYSKLNTSEGCLYNYFLSYILKQRSPNNVYSVIGGIIHDDIEEYYHGSKTLEECRENLIKNMDDCEQKGIYFPESDGGIIRNNYIKNMEHFYKHHNKMDYSPENGDMMTEVFVLYKTPNTGKYLQMYIDVLTMDTHKDNNGNEYPVFQIGDWKSSSKFAGDKLKKAGRQLILYALGVEQQTGKKVDKVYWNMLKYCKVHYNVKRTDKTTGERVKTKRESHKLCQRKQWVKEIRDTLTKDLIALGTNEVFANIKIEECIKNNSIETLPQSIQDDYVVTDGIVEYELSDEIKQEVIDWVEERIEWIEKTTLDKNGQKLQPILIESKFNPTEIDEKSSFFCKNLCRGIDCPHYKAYFDKAKQEYEDAFNKKNTVKTHGEVNKDINEMFKNTSLDSEKETKEQQKQEANDILKSFFG